MTGPGQRPGGDGDGAATEPGLRCTGCGHVTAADQPDPFRCPHAGDGRDHVLARTGPPPGVELAGDGDPQPFVRYRAPSHAYQVARRRGLSDAEVVALIRALDAAVAAVDGRGFAITPYTRAAALDAAVGLGGADRPGGLWIKDETGNVAGSHKARHLFGLAVWLAVAERTGLTDAAGAARPAAIASCGNAALAAAVIARAAGRRLQVFVPPWAEPAVIDRLVELGAEVTACPRAPGDPPGDPCYHRFRAAVDGGAVPLCCQGSDNGLTIDGGMTLGFELAAQDAAAAAAPLDRVFVQVGGGALASAVGQALAWAAALGALARPPALHAVQTEGGFPLVRAWRRVAAALAARVGGGPAAAGDGDTGGAAVTADAELAAWLAARADAAAIDATLAAAAADRAAYMWPWQPEPRSVATGILDDETYDWLAVVRAMLTTGGHPVVAAEATVIEAHRLAVAAGHAVSATGSAGLAGAVELARAGRLPAGDRVAVLFTGVARPADGDGGAAPAPTRGGSP